VGLEAIASLMASLETAILLAPLQKSGDPIKVATFLIGARRWTPFASARREPSKLSISEAVMLARMVVEAVRR
jgi:hypothetical protein